VFSINRDLRSKRLVPEVMTDRQSSKRCDNDVQGILFSYVCFLFFGGRGQGFDLCLIPNSCKGEEQSVSPGSYCSLGRGACACACACVHAVSLSLSLHAVSLSLSLHAFFLSLSLQAVSLSLSLSSRPNHLSLPPLQVYEGVAELRVYRCSGGGTNDGAVFPSLQACRLSCSLTGGSCSSLSTVT
jgi:hypothetical protein